MTSDEKYQRAIEQGDPATAVIPWANQGKPVDGYVYGDLFIFRLNGEVVSVEKSSVEKSLKVKMGMEYR